MKKMMISFGVVLTLLLVANTVLADWAGLRRVTVLDSLSPTTKFVTLESFNNPSCDENRILIAETDSGYQKELFSMLLSAYLSGRQVNIWFTVSGGQCRGSRIILQ